ncbi:MAG TPA: acyltransferase family protein [Acidimicrobiales bacterium]|nr:acyltransferase family protein [Acidimicrobiales bacterium]
MTLTDREPAERPHRERAPAADAGPWSFGFRADIEGLRAVAVLGVVLYHAGVGAFRGGYVGVDVFFVVSGFLITGLLWQELRGTGRLSLASFYARRARRLLPASMLVVAVTVVASAYWLSPLRAEHVAKDALAAATYVSNYRFAWLRTDYFTAHADPSPLQHYWSLGVEEQFYLLWPAVLLVAALGGRRRTPSFRRTVTVVGVLGTASLVLSVWLTDANQPWAFFSLPTRAWELAAGAVLALTVPWLRRVPAWLATAGGWLGLALVGWSFVALGPFTPFPGTAALLPVGGTAAVIAFGCRDPRAGAGALLRLRPFQVVGKLSYSWYLWHWPVIALAPAVAGRRLGVGPNLVLAAVSGLLALATVRAVEDPVRFSPWVTRRPARTLVVAGGVTVTAAVVAVLVAVGLPQSRGRVVAPSAQTAATPTTLPAGREASRPTAAAADPVAAAAAPVLAAVARSVDRRELPANLEPPLRRASADRARPFVDGCHAGFTEARLRPCVYAHAQSPTGVMLVGDSHATQWFPALDRVAAERGWKLVSLTKSTCPPFPIAVWSPDLGRHYRECDAWRDAVLARVRADRPALVVLGVARHYGPEFRFEVHGRAWLDGLADMVRLVQAEGARAVVLGPPPLPAGDVPDCLSSNLSQVVACTQRPEEGVDMGALAAERAAVVGAGGTYVDVTQWFCAATCAVVVDNLLVYRDDNHLTTSYASWLAPVVGAHLDRALAGR